MSTNNLYFGDVSAVVMLRLEHAEREIRSLQNKNEALAGTVEDLEEEVAKLKEAMAGQANLDARLEALTNKVNTDADADAAKVVPKQ